MIEVDLGQTEPHCIDCDYCLIGLSRSDCPECGRGFDIDDPSTFISVPTRPPVHEARPDGIGNLQPSWHLPQRTCSGGGQWSPDDGISWEDFRARNVPLLRKLVETYGTCVMAARDGEQIVGFLRLT